VGKSTLLEAVAKVLEFQHLQASALIRKGRETLLGQAVQHDSLRFADLDESQRLLVHGFEASINATMPLVVLDGHTLIERESDYFVVGPEVFSAIGVDGMVFLREIPQEIALRRANDQARDRPERDAKALTELQAQTLFQAQAICRAVGVPLYIEEPSNVAGVVDLLRRIRDVKAS
jgi:adenylate kinase